MTRYTRTSAHCHGIIHDQPALLAHWLNAANSLYQLNVPHREGGYGNLILSRWPFQTHQHVSLRFHQRKPRGAQLVVVSTPDGPLHLVNWHLGLAEKERRWQVNHLLHHPSFLASAHLPTLIAGDYNDWRNTLEGFIFARHRFHQATSPLKQFRSFPSFMMMMALDKLFYRGRDDLFPVASGSKDITAVLFPRALDSFYPKRSSCRVLRCPLQQNDELAVRKSA